MKLEFRFIEETVPGEKWRGQFHTHWPAYAKWFLHEGIGKRETYLAGLTALKSHMPELMPVYERLCELSGGGDLPARFLSFFRPPAYLAGCSQLAIRTEDGPLLIRNYDYSPHLCEGTVLLSAWCGRKVLASLDCLWGVLDGINEDGLAVSLTFGGRQVIGRGFGVPLILRYVLETCTSIREAVEVFQAIPCHMAYNITLLDRSGRAKTVFVAPDEPPIVREQRYAVNHQDDLSWSDYLRLSRSFDRERRLKEILAHRRRRSSLDLIARFQSQPLYSTTYRRGFGTVYTVAYSPGMNQASYLWPGLQVRQSLHDFRERRESQSYTDRATIDTGLPVFRPSEL